MGLFNAGVYATFLCSALIYSTVGAISVANTNPVAVREDASGYLFNINAAGATSYTLNDPTSTFLVDASSGVVSLKANEKLDYESQQTYTVTVTASDGTNTATATLTVSLIDVNDEPPFYMTTNHKPLCVVTDRDGHFGTYKATDRDGTSPNNVIRSYSVTVGDVAKFMIDDRGFLSTKPLSLSYDDYGRYILLVKATDGGMPPLTGTTTLTLTLTDSYGCRNFRNCAEFISGTLVAMTTALLHVCLKML